MIILNNNNVLENYVHALIPRATAGVDQRFIAPPGLHIGVSLIRDILKLTKYTIWLVHFDLAPVGILSSGRTCLIHHFFKKKLLVLFFYKYIFI